MFSSDDWSLYQSPPPEYFSRAMTKELVEPTVAPSFGDGIPPGSCAVITSGAVIEIQRAHSSPRTITLIYRFTVLSVYRSERLRKTAPVQNIPDRGRGYGRIRPLIVASAGGFPIDPAR